MFFFRASDAGFAHYLEKIEAFPVLDREAEAVLTHAAVAGDRLAADRLICSNLRYVVRIASRYQGYGFRLADLVSEGNLGLLEAIKRFEPARGLRFMTYAGYWVRALILGHILRQWSLVGVGTGPLQSKMFFRLHRERGKLQARLGDREQATARLATKFGTTQERILEMEQRLDGHDVSLDAPAFADGDAQRIDLLRDDQDNAEDRVAGAEERQRAEHRIWRAMKALDARESMIVRRRLMTDEPATLAELGTELNLSRERVRQIEARARQKLRRALEPQAA